MDWYTPLDWSWVEEMNGCDLKKGGLPRMGSGVRMIMDLMLQRWAPHKDKSDINYRQHTRNLILSVYFRRWVPLKRPHLIQAIEKGGPRGVHDKSRGNYRFFGTNITVSFKKKKSNTTVSFLFFFFYKDIIVCVRAWQVLKKHYSSVISGNF